MVYGQTIEQLHQQFLNKKLSIADMLNMLELDLTEHKILNAVITDIIPDYKKTLTNSTDKNNSNLLNGVPFAIKDNFCTKGILTTAGSKILKNFVPVYDSTVTSKLQAVGALGVAKTAMDELGMGGHGLYCYTGDVLNPWDHTRIIGGSSSGSAALVASGTVPFALGTDTGDSVRKPAGYSGIIGFKPSYGLISRYGVIPYAPSLDTVGFFTRTIRDSAIVLDQIAGLDHLDATSIFSDENNYLKNLNSDFKKIKLAYFKPVRENLNPQFAKEYDVLYQRLSQSNFVIDKIDFPIELLQAILPIYMIISFAESTSTHSNLDGINFGVRVGGNSYEEVIKNSRTQGFGNTVKQRFLIGSFALARENQELLFMKAKKIRHLIVKKLNEIFNHYDGILLPPSNSVAPLISEVRASVGEYNQLEFMENLLVLGNLSGYPSLTLPVGLNNGLPFGINITTKAFNEQLLLNIGLAFEKVTGISNQYCR